MRTYIYRDQVICESCAHGLEQRTVQLAADPAWHPPWIALNEEPNQIRESDTCPLCNRYLLEDPDHEDDQL